MNTPIAALRWKYDEEKRLNATHYVYRVPFLTRQVEEIEFYRKLSPEEMQCFEPCLVAGRWRMKGETEWRTGDIREALNDGK